MNFLQFVTSLSLFDDFWKFSAKIQRFFHVSYKLYIISKIAYPFLENTCGIRRFLWDFSEKSSIPRIYIELLINILQVSV